MARNMLRLERMHCCTISILAFVISQILFVWLVMRNNQVDPSTSKLLFHYNLIDKMGWRKFIVGTPDHSKEFYQYNVQLSDKTKILRNLPETRDKSCGSRTYSLPPASQAKVSIVISYHNEARSMLLRTVISLVSRTPEDYFHELILIDDFSEDVNLLKELELLMHEMFAGRRRSPTLIFLRNSQRMGLIWSRNKGVSEASGHYLFFLDSHCEVNDGWLEPLLDRLALNPTRAVSPLVDPIDPSTFGYQQADNELLKGGFDWSLHFHWVPRQLAKGELPQQAYSSPTFAGGILMISREWLLKLQGFNPHLKIWGGESIELAIKLWLCGGQIEIVPCSRIGHIYRSRHAFRFPSLFEDQLVAALMTHLLNSKIIAESWLDEYKYLFYSLKPDAIATVMNYTDQGYDVLSLKKRLQCKTFDWYLDHVYKELKPTNADSSALGTLRNGDRCVQDIDFYPVLVSCYMQNISHWALDRHTGKLSSTEGYCLGGVLDETERKTIVQIDPCLDDKSQYWRRQSTQLVHEQTQLCLDNTIQNQLELSICRQRPIPASQSFQFALEMERQT
ncbi:putative polypeptide N-acetylgalactosaminyltransferase 13 [Drosophila willistoni]|nr:putative polypeptide N-acetylgalactosaminyltransferase 13 [Drosophila willistoni]